MGFDINKVITTKLHYKDIACIAAACDAYKNNISNPDNEVIERMTRLVNRLGSEMYNVKRNDEN